MFFGGLVATVLAVADAGWAAPIYGPLAPVPERVDAAPDPTAGAWIFPVGDSLDLDRPVGDRGPYRITRGVSSSRSAAGRHDGADLSNRTQGDRVRAAALGRVAAIRTDRHDSYGCCVVLAHHLGGDTLIYSVYAHLEPGSIPVEFGQLVPAGETLGRVGSTGRATHPHLHFEVRVADDAAAPWQNAQPRDPVAFVRARLPTTTVDTTWFAPYVAWAELAGLVPRNADPSKPVPRLAWSHMVRGLAAETPPSERGRGPDAPVELGDSSADPIVWSDIARDLVVLGNSHVPALAVRANRDAHRRLCAERLGVAQPARHPERLAARDGPPTLADALLALADLTLTRAPSRAR